MSTEDVARAIVRLGRDARASSGMNVTQPLARAFVGPADDAIAAALRSCGASIAEELNVQSLWMVTAEELAGPREERAVASDASGLTVSIDTAITPPLLALGTAQAFARGVQAARDGLDGAAGARIRIRYAASPSIVAAVSVHSAMICDETDAVSLEAEALAPGGGGIVHVRGEHVRVLIERVSDTGQAEPDKETP